MTDQPKRKPGRPKGTGENRQLLGNLRLPPDQIAWLKAQGRPASKVIQDLIRQAMAQTVT